MGKTPDSCGLGWHVQAKLGRGRNTASSLHFTVSLAAPGDILAGVIDSLGRKHDRKAVSAIAQLMRSPNTIIAQSAASALGNIGGDEAAAELEAARKRSGASSKLRPVINDAYLLCADRFVKDGKNAKAQAIYEKLYSPGERKHVRSAALRGMVSVSGDRALAIVMKPLTSSDPALQAIAVSHVIDIPGEAATKAFAAQLPKVSTSCRVLLLGALARRGDKAALPQVVASLKDRTTEVRMAAAEALGKLGNASAVVPLASAAASAEGAEAKTALDSLTRLSGPNINDTIVRALKSSPAKTQVMLIKSLSARRAIAAVPALLKCAEEANKSVRTEAFKALGGLADAKALPSLVKLLCKTRGASERSAAEKAVSTVAGKIDDPQQRSVHILPALPAARGAMKASLLKVLGKCGGAKALDGNPDTRWDTAGPMRKGMWFMLDQKVEKQVGRIVLECRKSAGDYPRGYELYLSNDNNNWGKAIATGKGTSPVVTISFKPQYARFVKIVQTGESDRMYWSIHTFKIEPK